MILPDGLLMALETSLFLCIINLRPKFQILHFLAIDSESCHHCSGLRGDKKEAEPFLGEGPAYLGLIIDSSKWTGRPFSQAITMRLKSLKARYRHGGRGDPPL